MEKLFTLSFTKEQLDVVVYALNEVPLPAKVSFPLATSINQQIAAQSVPDEPAPEPPKAE